jgi:HK97 family phage major capsid protein
MASTAREASLRKEYIDKAVKAVALMEYKLKTLCTIDKSEAWTESYYRETNTTEATGGGTGSPVNGIPQMAPFPFIEPSWTKVSSVVKKYGAEYVISMETNESATIPILARAILRVSRTVAYSVDAAIEAAILAGAGNTKSITAGYEWDAATIANRDPIKDILDAIQLIREDGFDALNGNGYLVVNGTDYNNIISNSKVINNPTFKSADVVSNGVVGQICGLKIMISEAVTADYAYVVIAKEALTWKEADALQVVTIEDPGKSILIRAWERGVCQVPSPNAICKITNTRA